MKKFFTKKWNRQIKSEEIQSEPDIKTRTKTFTILIVDDADINRYVLKKYISKLMPNVVLDEASNGIESVDMAKTKHYDIIFMDIKMPGLDGIGATEMISKNDPCSLIYGVTGQIEKESVMKALSSGMKGCIAKPLDRNEIYRILNDFYN